MKFRVLFVLIPITLFVSACEKHPVSDLQKIGAEAERAFLSR
jgi:hypothetical protein